MKRFFSQYYPISLFAVGVALHLINIHRYISKNAAFGLWQWWVDISMAVFNLLMVIGLLRRRRIAYIVSMTGLFALILFQAVNAIFAQTLKAVSIVSWSLCIIAILVLWVDFRERW